MGRMLEEYNIGFMDCGTSGGVWGLDNGYCLMVGASHEVAKAVEPVLRALAPTPQKGWLHVGPVGSGHFTKMIHNGIEYGMMELKVLIVNKDGLLTSSPKNITDQQAQDSPTTITWIEKPYGTENNRE